MISAIGDCGFVLLISTDFANTSRAVSAVPFDALRADRVAALSTNHKLLPLNRFGRHGDVPLRCASEEFARCVCSLSSLRCQQA